MQGLTGWYHDQIVATGKQPLLLLFVAFIVTFAFIRFSVRMIRAEVSWWPGNVQPGGLHVHHVVFGTVFMLIAGVGGASATGDHSPWRELFAIGFGIGAALVLDEFALILHLKDVYWSEEGRTSVDAVFLAVAFVGLIVVGETPFGASTADAHDTASRAAVVLGALLNAGFVVVALFKGKVVLGLIGVVVPMLALVCAVRVARPGSPWARRWYQDKPKKMAKAVRRDQRWHEPWSRRRRGFIDLVGGAHDLTAPPVGTSAAPADTDGARVPPARDVP